MMKLFRTTNQILNRHSGQLLLLGTALVGARNWQLWQRDKQLVRQLCQQRPAQPVLNRTPKVSVLVAAWNESQRITAHINSFLALNYPDIELILCAGGSNDTFQKAKQFASDKIQVLEQYPGEGKQHALARCYELALGEIIYLTDADCLFDEQALLHMLAPIINEGEQVTTGSSRPLNEQLDKLFPAYIWAADTVSNAISSDYVQGLLGRNAAITRQVLEQSGGLDFVAHTGTDYQLARRLLAAGVKLRHASNSVIASEFPENLEVYRKKQSRWLRNLLIYGRQYGAKQDVQATVKTVAVGTFMTLVPLIAPLAGRKLLLPWSLLVMYAVCSKVRYAAFTAHLYQRKVSIKLIASLIPLTLLDFAVWASPTLDLLNSKRRTMW